jgi:hypothetical protein
VILERKVSIQLARKPEPQAEGATSGGEGSGTNENRRRGSNRGRGRGRGRGGRAARGGRAVSYKQYFLIGSVMLNYVQDGDANGTKAPEGAVVADAPAAKEVPANGATEAAKSEDADKERAPRKQRGPPEDGIASKTKVMVANLPYDLREDKVIEFILNHYDQG